MGEKSFVTILTEVCVACGKEVETGDLAMDTRIKNGKLRETFERTTCMGVCLCDDCKQAHIERDTIHLFVIEEQPDGHAIIPASLEVSRQFLEDTLPDFPDCTEQRICRITPQLAEELQKLERRINAERAEASE